MKNLHSCCLTKTILLWAAMIIMFCTVSAHAQNTNNILASGSRNMYFAVTDLARHYGDKNPNANITVSATDSDTGFRKFLNREIDVLHVLPCP